MDARGFKPIPGQVEFWIIDASVEVQYGPFTEDEFTAKRKVLSVPDKITLWGTDWYRP